MNVPILDDAYMEHRARLRYMQAMSESWRSLDRQRPLDTKDTAESLREEYARGALTFEQFERRLERVLGCSIYS